MIPSISLDLMQHEVDQGLWMTWDDFSTYMKEMYGSPESGYTRFMHLRVMLQGNDSLNKYYGCFRRMLGHQRKPMRDPEEMHVYHYMFLAGLKKEVNGEVLRMPESLHMQDMKFSEVLELAK